MTTAFPSRYRPKLLFSPGTETGFAPELGELAALMEQARALAAYAELPIPKAAVRHALALMTAQLRAARGLPPLAPRQTKPKNGQTVEHDSSVD
jgi:hypothetical protein